MTRTYSNSASNVVGGNGGVVIKTLGNLLTEARADDARNRVTTLKNQTATVTTMHVYNKANNWVTDIIGGTPGLHPVPAQERPCSQ